MKNKLPKLPSACIRVALKDLNKCRIDQEHYILNMKQWCNPTSNGKCHVCLAGSVMAQTLGHHHHHNDPDDFNRYTKMRLFMLNDFRIGYIESGLGWLDYHDLPLEFVEPVYRSLKKDYNLRYLRELADTLEQVGL